MSKSMGARLPERLVAELGVEHSDKVLVLTTVDDGGSPHPALLAAASVEARGARALRVTLMASSRTAANLALNGKLTLALVDPAMVYYVKATLSRPAMPQDDGMVRVEVSVDDVLEDTPAPLEAGSAIQTGITFRRAGPLGPG